MKAISKILYFLLGIVILGCLIIVISAVNPDFSKGLSVLSHSFVKSNIESDESGENASYVDIESILKEIEEREQKETAVEEKRIDLGLVDATTFSSMDEYYSKLIEIIRENYVKGTIISFKIQIDESIFQEWYEANYTDNGNNVADDFSFDVSYKYVDDGYYEINHEVTFN